VFLLQASRLLAASLILESALTDTVIRKEPKDTFICKVPVRKLPFCGKDPIHLVEAYFVA
jgi:hypothetical protein